MRPRTAAHLFTLLTMLMASTPVLAQPWSRFAVPDSLLGGVIRSSGTGYETAWNTLRVATLRARLTAADSLPALEALAARVASAETSTLGTTIAADALALSKRWSPAEARARVAAAVAESTGVAAVAARDYASADVRYVEALAAYQELGERRRAAWVMGSRGVAAFQSQNYARADSLYQLALAARRTLGDARMIGASLNSIGSMRILLHREAEAYAYLVGAREIRERTGERGGLVATLNSLALVHEALGHPDSAQAVFTEALGYASAAGDSARVLEVASHLARHLVMTGDAEAATAMAERAMVIASAAGDEGSLAHIEEQLGAAAALAGRFADAQEHFAAALDHARSNGDPRAEMSALLQLGRRAVELQDAREARPPLERAVVLADSLHDPRMGTSALDNLAIACRLEGDTTRALVLARQALAAATSAGDSVLVRDAVVTLGQLALDREDFVAAASWFRRARAAVPNSNADQAIVDDINLATANSHLGRLDEAGSGFAAARVAAERAEAPELIWPAELGLGDVAERRGDMPGALGWYRRAATRIDTLRARQGAERASIVLLSRRLFAFEALIHLLGKLAPQYPDSLFDSEAFDWAERTRARALLDLLNAQGRDAGRRQPVTLAQARAALPSARFALLEYSLGDSSSSLWVITRAAWKRFTLPARGVVQARCEMLRRSLADPAAAEGRTARTAARALYRSLIEPAAPLLGGCDRLLIAADGALTQIPFEALLSADVTGDAAVPANAYLVSRFAVSYTPSATAIAAGGSAAAAPRDRKPLALAIGDPIFGARPPRGMTHALAALPNTAAELATLSELLGPSRCTAIRGRAATRSALLNAPALATASVIHLATHGEADASRPERSGLWFSAASDSSEPDFVSLSDLFQLQISARLVTLSACETGLGRIERGEGVIGLSRAFLAAGARSVLVSLWSVNDGSTAILMREFYRPLLGEAAARDVALARAKRRLLADASTRSPFYWAPFVLVGDAGPLFEATPRSSGTH